MSNPTATRDNSINTLRAFAIFIVVLYHAVLADAERAGRFYFEFEILIRYIPLEIFTAVSGYLYASRPIGRGDIARSLQVKARRLLLPLVTMTTVLLVMRIVMPGVNKVPGWSDVLRAYAFRFEHLWYLQSLFLIFVVISIIDGFALIRSARACAALIIGWYVISLALPLNGFFGYAGLVQLMPYFLAGYALRRWPELLHGRGAAAIAWSCFAGGMLLEQLDARGVLPLPDIIVLKWGILNLIVGFAFCALAFRYRREVPGLGPIGNATFSIYIFHTIGMAVANRLASLTPWDEGIAGLIVLKVLLGMLLPIALEMGIRRSHLLSTLFLGEAWKTKWPAGLARAKSATSGTPSS
jgi:peptidoglycan/LPS O-acetylase OafA/YrhL